MEGVQAMITAVAMELTVTIMLMKILVMVLVVGQLVVVLIAEAIFTWQQVIARHLLVKAKLMITLLTTTLLGVRLTSCCWYKECKYTSLYPQREHQCW